MEPTRLARMTAERMTLTTLFIEHSLVGYSLATPRSWRYESTARQWILTRRAPSHLAIS